MVLQLGMLEEQLVQPRLNQPQRIGVREKTAVGDRKVIASNKR